MVQVIPALSGDATEQTPPDLPSYLFKERIVYVVSWQPNRLQGGHVLEREGELLDHASSDAPLHRISSMCCDEPRLALAL